MEIRIVKNEGYHYYGVHRPTSSDGHRNYTLKGLFNLLENDGGIHEVSKKDGFHVISRGNEYIFDAGVLTDLVLFRKYRIRKADEYSKNEKKDEDLEQKV